MFLYAARLLNQQQVSDQPIVPVRGLVLIDGIMNNFTPIVTRSFSKEYAENNEVKYHGISTDNVYAIYIQLPLFVNEENKTFSEKANMCYSILGQPYTLNNEAINWLKLYCARRIGLPTGDTTHQQYKIQLDVNSQAFIAAKSIEQQSKELENTIDLEDKYRGVAESAMAQGIAQGKALGILIIDKLASDLAKNTKHQKKQPKKALKHVLNFLKAQYF
ncbi:Hypothetical_protein [Hexamita inflata]|uniref:Hypothetical_protein n=1 Tax=Hexamita inflata TaxID=28002 RepID=A0AA86TMB2_9EUKA|nr:Hypothetical protein HINF_LOCUS9270 [Hexamita inflata]